MKKIISIILMIAMVFSVSVYGFAYSDEKDYSNNATVLEPVVHVNPLYKDVVNPDEVQINLVNGNAKYLSSDIYHEGTEAAGAELREYMQSRTNYATIKIKTNKFDGTQAGFENLCVEIINAALAHTGDPTEGDYIRWHYAAWGAGASFSVKNGYYYIDINFEVAYYTTAEQEAELTKEVNKVLDSLDLEDKNPYQKIYAIYDYICDNITYDYDNLYDDSYTMKYTAYAALMHKTAVCQGYASLFYRFALTEGIDARLIAGLGNGGPHGWNIVKMGDYYYNLDSTWDAGVVNYDYFLKCEKNFGNHIRYDEYNTAEFHAEYPMGQSDYVYDEGDFESDATLTISEGKVLGDKSCEISVSLSEESYATAIQFAVKYDSSALKLVSASAGSLTNDATINTEEKGIIYFAWDDSTPLTESGNLVELVFAAVNGAEAGDYSVEVDKTKGFVFSKKDLKDIMIDVVNGKVTLIDAVIGDISGDDEVNIKDAYLARLVAAKLIVPTEEQLLIGDVDGDGKITAIDANILRKYAAKIIKELPVNMAQ